MAYTTLTTSIMITLLTTLFQNAKFLKPLLSFYISATRYFNQYR